MGPPQTASNGEPSKCGDTDEGRSDNANFECNICLDIAKDAVISLCGHLFWYVDNILNNCNILETFDSMCVHVLCVCVRVHVHVHVRVREHEHVCMHAPVRTFPVHACVCTCVCVHV